MQKYLPAIALGVAIVPGCSNEPQKRVDESPKTVEQLAAEAQREIEILTPSLEKAAQEMLADVRPRSAQYEGKCGLVWEIEEDEPKMFVAPAELVMSKDDSDRSDEDPFFEKSFDVFVSPKGERLVRKWFNTKTIYSLTAVNKRYRFKSRGIQRIIRTGQMDAPLMGVVEFDVVQAIRTASRSQDIPLPVPEHYRLPREGDLPEGLRELRSVPYDIGVLYEDDGFYPSLRPFRASGPENWPREELPKEVQAVIDELFETCHSAEPTEYTETQTVGFRYWVAEKRWDWRTDQERARYAELAKQPSSDKSTPEEKPEK